jgi:hypothetical protein
MQEANLEKGQGSAACHLPSLLVQLKQKYGVKQTNSNDLNTPKTQEPDDG